MKTHLPSLVAAATALLLSAGCASDLSGSTYSRDGARAHNADWGHGCDHSWTLYGGIALGVSF